MRIESTEDKTTESSGNPKLIVDLSSPHGSMTDFIPYHGGFLDKIVALFNAAEIDLPGEGEFDPEDNCRLTAACRKRLHGKSVGVVVREEEDGKGERDANGNVKMWSRVKGYVTVGQIPGGGGAVQESLPASNASSGQRSASRPANEPDIPF
jgi:hypothetical protein